VRIDIDHLITIFEDISSKYDLTLVEGAGGLMVPLLPSYTYADLARVLKLPVIVVAANRLGAINHLLLTLEHAGCKGLSVLGYVLNHVSNEASVAAETNREVLSGLTGMQCVGELPYLKTAQPGELPPPDAFEADFNLQPVIALLLRR
jgi:dethiobiotin synthetase